MFAAYDKGMLSKYTLLYYSGSDFYNFGYWESDTENQKEASEQLVERLLALLPGKQGNILDVACGLGASTRHLLRYYKPEDIKAINLSEAQLRRARENAPGVECLYMDAANLEFPDESFDNVICVESAFHFKTREAFLREALRILKPGGWLVDADMLISPMDRRGIGYIPEGNGLADPEALRVLLMEIGFESAVVQDTTAQCLDAMFVYMKRWPHLARQAGDLSRLESWLAHTWLFFYRRGLKKGINYYVLASAQKPLGQR